MVIGSTGIISTLLNNKKLILILGLVGFGLWQQFRIYSLKNEVLEQQLQIQQLETNNQTIQDALDNQNKKIKIAEDKNKEYQKRIDELDIDLKEEKAKSDAEIERILNEETPQTCDAIAEYLLNGLGDLRWNE